MDKELEEGLKDLTLEAIIGVLHQQYNDEIPPAWLCMSKQAKAKYHAIGEEVIKNFKKHEERMLEARKIGNPRAYFR